MGEHLTERQRRRQEQAVGALEHRVFNTGDLEVRESGNSDTATLFGHAAVFDVLYSMGSFQERVARSAFTRTLGELPDVVLNANHGAALSGLPLARTASAKGGPGTLKLSVDDFGLAVHADLDPEDPDVIMLRRKLARGDLGTMSMAFRCLDDHWDDAGEVRTLRTISLHSGDVSIVGTAASPTTDVSIRALELTRQAAARRPLGPSRSQLDRERMVLLSAGRARPAELSDPRSRMDRRRLERLRRQAR